MTKKNSIKGLSAKEIIILLIILTFGITYVFYIRESSINQEREKVLQIASSIEASIPKDEIAALPENPTYLQNQDFSRLKEILQKIIVVNKNVRFAYFYMERNNKLFFIVDSEPKTSEDYSPPGQEYTEASPIDKQPFIDGKAQLTSPTIDRWGTWVSAEVPVKDIKTGNVVAVFGMDYDANSWRNRIWLNVSQSILMVLIILILFVAMRLRKLRNDFLKLEIQNRKIIEKQLHKFSLAIEQNPVAVVITNADGNIEYVNPKFTEITGYTDAEVIGKNPRIIKSGLMKPDLYTDLWQTIKSGKIWNGELINKSKSGALYWSNKSISPIIDEQGNITNFVSIAEDITEKKKNEDELIKAKEKAEESDRLKSAFLANISHEIRTPMNGILGFAELLKEPGLDIENQMEFLGIIVQSGQRMLNIINDLIDISKIAAGATNLRIQKTNINDILQEIHLFFLPEVNKKNIHFDYHCALPGEDCYMLTDGTKLNQILTNLIKNAIKFTQKGSITFGYTCKESKFEFYVSDTGSGIPADQLEVVFERFIQGTMSLTRNHEGAGLGLAISKAYVEMLGGSIRVDTELGKGSTFTFELPIISQEKVMNA